MHPKKLAAFLSALLIILVGTFIFGPSPSNKTTQTALLPGKKKAAESAELEKAPPPPPRDAFGILSNSFDVSTGTIERNETLIDILAPYDFSYAMIQRMVRHGGPVFDVRSMRPGKRFRVYLSADSTEAPGYFIYEKTKRDYVVFDLRDSMRVYTGRRPVELVQRHAEGVIKSSLYETMTSSGAPVRLARRLARMYAWQIDFFRIRKSDNFEVVYEEQQLDGEPVGIGRILAARFTHRDSSYFGFYFESDEQRGYYDEQGASLRKAFLQAPLEYYTITSSYQKGRLHPVLRQRRDHLGTDYAAAEGTPVHSTAEGVVTEAQYGRWNGNYVKVRHNATYTTQYLHFSRIAHGIEPGVRVKQGQVIGYIGSTGLATGPHVCYRFWKDGRQVDPYEQTLPPADPIHEEYRDAFEQVKAKYWEELDPSFGLEAPAVAEASNRTR